MFIYSLRASTLKFFGIALAGVVALVAVLIIFPGGDALPVTSDGAQNVNYEKIKTPQDRIDFLLQFGYSVEPEAAEEKKVTIPSEFDKTMSSYNELQKDAGLDIYRYRGKEVEFYSYVVTNYPDYDGRVLANLLIYRGRVIGGDICSADVNGFIHGLRGAK